MDLRRWMPLAVAAIAWAAGCSSGEGPTPAPQAAAVEASRKPVEAGMQEKQVRETVVLAGGCFWGMQELLRKIPGVLETEAGYCGGDPSTAAYEFVHLGNTGHAESVRVVYDPARLSFDGLLHWFFRMHDPTTRDRQGNDVGSQYRSAIFWTTEEQRAVAEKVKAEVDRSGKWGRPLVTEIRKAGPWTRAEEAHQDYLQKHPDGYTCHFLRD